MVPVIQDLEDEICEEDERLQDFVEGLLFCIYHFILKKWRTSFVFEATDTPVFVLLVTSALDFKARVHPLAWVLHRLSATDSSEKNR